MTDSLLVFGARGRLGSAWLRCTKSEVNKICLHRDLKYAGKLVFGSPGGSVWPITKLGRLIESSGVSGILNFAAITDVDLCEVRKKDAWQSHVELPFRLAELSSAFGLKFCTISTDQVFSGKLADGKYEECFPVSPLNFYGESKAFGEKAVLSSYAKALIIRTNFFGNSFSGKPSYSEHVLRRLKSGETTVVSDQRIFSPLEITKLVETIDLLWDASAAGIFHCSSDDAISRFDFCLRLAEKYRLDKSLLVADRADSLVPRGINLALDNVKVCKYLGVQGLGSVDQQISIEAACGLK